MVHIAPAKERRGEEQKNQLSDMEKKLEKQGR